MVLPGHLSPSDPATAEGVGREGTEEDDEEEEERHKEEEREDEDDEDDEEEEEEEEGRKRGWRSPILTRWRLPWVPPPLKEVTCCAMCGTDVVYGATTRIRAVRY
eukprot:130996-Rhodomonas_salina.8